MSVFLALVFQVLFVFFAMVINIGLLVHDKINLQNSVDLGAYYAAQKQAEILNEIAHLNYQIRQDYKLLAWRYWVLGTLGRDAQGAARPPATSLINATEGPINGPPFSAYGAEVPVACLANPFWWEFSILSYNRIPNENYCWHQYGWTSGSIPIVNAPFTPATIGVNMFAQSISQQSSSNFVASCEAASPLSWAFVAAIMTDYKYSIAYKKKAIKKLRENLVSETPLDRNGKPIREGVILTIKKNLTESNLQSFDPTTVQLMNGLTKGGGECALSGGERTLPEILTAPGLYYALLRSAGRSCTFHVAFQTQYNQVSGGEGAVVLWDPFGVMRSLVGSEPLPSSEFHSSLGFEKNPWCMAYMGVKANTSPRKPFAPFGKPVDLVARAFAQPFGGRIGPWYSKRWFRDEVTSENVAPPAVGAGTSTSTTVFNPVGSQMGRTDPLTSPRLSPGTGGSFVYSAYSIPNFARFPGDQLGMRSALAQQTARGYFRSTITSAIASAPNFADGRVRLNWFYGYGLIGQHGDTLAFDPVASNSGTYPAKMLEFRRLEAAAVAPNLFDITHYSIEPDAYNNYNGPGSDVQTRYGISGPPVGDLGSRQGFNMFQEYNIQNQIEDMNSSGIDPVIRQAVFWMVKKWDHLLTGWAPNRATDFSFPAFRFGKCDKDAGYTHPVPGTMIPGKCVAGGRVGYSVRLISRAHLNGEWQVGGMDTPAGPILNPPGDDTQF